MFRRSDSVSKSKSSNPIVRLFKSIISITILSAFILVLSLFIRELSTMSSDKFANLSGALLSRVHVKIDERQVGDVAGKFVARLTDVGISSNEATKESTAPVVTTNEALFKVAILSDIHQDFTNLDKALILCKKNNVSAIFLLGDLTDFGDVASLEKVKATLDASGILYYAIPGDHDLAQSVGATNFIKVFGNNYELVDVKGKKFLMVDNSANYTPLEFSTMTALTKDIPNVDFVLLSQPIFTDGLSVFFANKYMGSSSLLNDSNSVYKDSVQRLNDQRLQILSDLRSSKVSAVFVGDHHQSSTLVDSTKSSLKYFVVGAVSSTVNEFPQKIFQSSRFSVLTVFENGGYQTEEIVLE